MKRKFVIFIVAAIAVILLIMNDYSLYSQPIGKIIEIKNTQVKTEKGYDGRYEYEEKYYNQEITAKIMNGDYKGQNVILKNNYTYSGVYDTEFSKGDQIFVESIEKTDEDTFMTGKISGAKRDYYVAAVLVVLFGLFLLIGGKSGVLTIASLGINLAAFYMVLLLYNKGINILFVSIPMSVFFTMMLLFFMYGWNRRTMLSFVATIISVGFTTLIAFVALKFGYNVDYDFLDYLNQPYDPVDAGYIFMAELLIGCLGAVTDVVVTVVMTVDQIVKTSPDTDKKSLVQSCRNVGDDIVGTMINIMFFTNVASCIPFFILAMRNGVAVLTILKYNVFFELARFLCGSIGVVLAIPVSTAVAVYFCKRQVSRAC